MLHHYQQEIDNLSLQWLLKILNKHLANERAWLRRENMASIDIKYAHGARMAKERIPQLEQAIALLINSSKTQVVRPKTKPKPTKQLNLFK